jgi:hypothetical protein
MVVIPSHGEAASVVCAVRVANGLKQLIEGRRGSARLALWASSQGRRDIVSGSGQIDLLPGVDPGNEPQLSTVVEANVARPVVVDVLDDPAGPWCDRRRLIETANDFDPLAHVRVLGIGGGHLFNLTPPRAQKRRNRG